MGYNGQRPAPIYVFEPFRLDVADQRLWRQQEPVPLGRKALLVLHCLLSHAGRLVTKEELLAAAWPDTAVGDAVLTTAVRELRRALDDRARAPSFVETVHGSGYRFIAQVSSFVAQASWPLASRRAQTDDRSRSEPTPHFIGRGEELAQLREWWAAARRGSRRIGFVAGEAGLGKTALVDAFLAEVDDRSLRIARGQSVEHYGAGEAYLPLLEALGRLGRDRSLPLAEILRAHAPSWLRQLPALLPAEERQERAPATAEKMLRELAEAIEVVTESVPLILVLEDLHWCDAATLDWLAYAARRRDMARLLVLVTYRPVEVLVRRHPLRSVVAELRQQRQCVELLLDYLAGSEVASYVDRRCPPISGLSQLAEILHRRTGGHPLFLATLVDELLRRDALRRGGDGSLSETELEAIGRMIPSGVRQFVERRFELLSESDRRILEGASVAGERFSVAAVAAATLETEERVEARCSEWLGEGGFLGHSGIESSPAGKPAARFRFRHSLFQEAVYSQMPPQRRARFHRSVAECLERAYGDGSAKIAAELAMHFEQGRELQRAVSYREHAARKALESSGYSEAKGHLVRGLELLRELPQAGATLGQELRLSLLLGQVLVSTLGWGVSEAAALYRRTRELCEELDDRKRLLSVIWGQMAVSVVRAELRETVALSGELLAHAQELDDSVFRTAAHFELGGTGLLLGNLAPAGEHFTQAAALYRPEQHPLHLERIGVDTGLFSRCWETHLLWLIGERERALIQSDETLRWAFELAHPFSRAFALAYAAMLRQLDRDAGQVEEMAKTTIEHCNEQGFPYYLAWGRVLYGWSRAMGGDETALDEIHGGLEILQTTAGIRLPYYRSLLAEALGRHGRQREALATLAEASAEVERTEERWWLAEIHRLRGELLSSVDESIEDRANACFRQAIEVARSQGARALERRAARCLGES